MGTAPTVLVAYFGGGLLALALFDLITKRIRTKLTGAVVTTQVKMLEANVVLGKKTGLATFLAVTWLFWPAVLIGAVTDRVEKVDAPAEQWHDMPDSVEKGGQDGA